MGGVLTTGFSWRAPFWFLAVVSGLSCASIFLFLKDTFRRERSLTYQSVLKSHLLKARSASAATSCTATITEKEPTVVSEKEQSVLSDKLPADLEKQDWRVSPSPEPAAIPAIKLTMRDVNPFRPLRQVLRRTNNLVILFASGACCFILGCAR
jgi:hypothetical protein